MKVLNITLHAIDNYGSVLQALATETIFRKLGCEVETIDYVRETAQLDSCYKIMRYGGPGMTLKVKQLISHLFLKKKGRAELFEKWRKENLQLTTVAYRSDNDFKVNPPIADVYCTGSDQTWNTVCQGGVPYPYFLSFVPEGKKRISFSASFGITSLPDKDVEEVRGLLKKYDAISIREKSGLDILEKMGIDGQVVLDPTLVVGADFWNQRVASPMIEGEYLLVYQLNRSEKFAQYVKNYAKFHNLKVAIIGGKFHLKGGLVFPYILPEEFMNLIRYAKVVITDSFHATAFSVLFHRQFINIYPPHYSTRVDSFLKSLNLTNQHVINFEDMSYGIERIDYNEVDGVLSKERESTIEYLKHALN